MRASGFAVPSSRARRVAADLAEFGKVRRAYLGVTIRPVDAATAERLTNPSAALISSVGEPRACRGGGIRPGDVILMVNGKPAGGPGSLQAAIEVARVGEPLPLVVDRGGQILNLEVRPEAQPERYGLTRNGRVEVERMPGININVPGLNMVVPGPNIDIGPNGPSRPGESGEPPLTIPPPAAAATRPPVVSQPAAPGPQETVARSPTRFPDLGLRLAEPTSDLIRRFRFDREPRGLIVIGVEPDGPGDRGGLEVGMVITDASNRKVATLPEFREALANRPAGRDLLIRILKGSKAEFRVIVDPSGASAPPADPGPPAESPRLEAIPPPNPEPGASRSTRPN